MKKVICAFVVIFISLFGEYTVFGETGETEDELNIITNSLSERKYKYISLTDVYNVEIFTHKSYTAEQYAKNRIIADMNELCENIFNLDFALDTDYNMTYNDVTDKLFLLPKDKVTSINEQETSVYSVSLIVIIFICLGVISFLFAISRKKSTKKK